MGGPRFFGFRSQLLRLIGCWPRDGADGTGFERIYAIAASASLINYFVGASLSLYTLALFVAARESIETICNQMIAFIIAFQVLAKSGLTFAKSQEIRKLIRELDVELHERFVRRAKDRDTIRRCYRYDVKLSIFFCVFSSFVTAANIIKPLVVTLSRSGANDTEVVVGEFPSMYPFELEANSFWYAFWFGQQVSVVLPGGVASWISDSMFCAFLYYVCGHFDILARNIREGVHAGGREIATHHRRLIRFSKGIVAAFGPLMVIQLLLAAITICCLLIQFVSTKGGIVQYSRPLAYLTLKFIQAYIMCWHGQLLMDKSTEVGEALYSCPWYRTRGIRSSDLNIMMMRAGKAVEISYGGIFRLSAATFAQILNAAYGYFAMMSKMK